jgi:polyhydroxyalkanoate synthesis regulator phasin
VQGIGVAGALAAAGLVIGGYQVVVGTLAVIRDAGTQSMSLVEETARLDRALNDLANQVVALGKTTSEFTDAKFNERLSGFEADIADLKAIIRDNDFSELNRRVERLESTLRDLKRDADQ